MKTVAYCRVSTNKEEQLDSMESQRSFFLEYAKRHDYNLIHIYADEGKSGTRIKNRLQLQQLLIDGKDNKFELVLIKDVSRLARNTVDFLTSIRKLKSYGVKVVFVNYDQTSSESSEFMLTMLSAIAQEESANTSKRVKFGKRLNAEKGRVPNLCYGYDKIDEDYFNLNINEEEARIIKKVFKLYCKDGIGTGRIAKKLNKEGFRTKRDCKWTQTAISRILSNEIYTGKVINAKEEVTDFLTGQRVKNNKDKWIVVDKPELRIISDKTFNKARLILEERRSKHKQTRKRTSDKYVFSKLIWCDNCGYNFRRIVRTYKNTYVRWVCNGRNSKGADSCSNKTVIDEDELIININKYISRILYENQEYSTYIKSKACKSFNERHEECSDKKTYKREISKLKRERDKYINLYKADIISLTELQTFILELEEETELINSELDLINQNISKVEVIAKAAFKLFHNLEDVLKENQYCNNQIKKLIERIVVDEEGIVNIHIVHIDHNYT